MVSFIRDTQTGISFPVEWFSNHSGGEEAAADVDLKVGAQSGICGRQVGHGDACHQGRGERAAGEIAYDDATVIRYRIMSAGRGTLAGVLKGGEFQGRSIGFLSDEGFAAYEFCFFEVTEESQAGFYW